MTASPSDRASRPADQAPTGLGDAATIPDADRIAWQLEVVARQIESWIDWDRGHRRRGSLTTEDGTHIMALPVPFWPSHGQFGNWITLLREAAKAIEARRAATLGAVHESAVAESHSPKE